MIVILIVIIIVLALNLNDNIFEIKRLKNKIKQLEQKIKQLTNNTEASIEKNTSVQNISMENKEIIKSNENVTTNQNNIRVKDEYKNNIILVTGSIFIILAAIIFLSSTWRIIPNIIKTLTLLTLIVVFEGASKIAKNIFKLEQTSKTFHYLSIAYIPICLL